jgi:DNA polymerase-3 subunit epsilon
MIWFKKKSYPDFWSKYASSFKAKPSQLVSEVRFVVFDTETTGLNTKDDRILSIGCVGISALRIHVADHFECFLKQEHFKAETVKIHGLLKTGNQIKCSEETSIKLFLEYIQNAVLVAHHAAFDVAMINEGLKRLGVPKLKNKIIDTGQLHLKTLRNPKKQHYSLDELCDYYKIAKHDRHTASGDAFITALLFIKLFKRLNKHKTATLNDLLSANNRIGLL